MKVTLKTHCYKISEKNHEKVQALMSRYGSAEAAFTVLLAEEKSAFVRGDFVRAGEHPALVLESDTTGWVKIRLMQDGLVIKVQADDLAQYEPSNAELLEWRLTGKKIEV